MFCKSISQVLKVLLLTLLRNDSFQDTRKKLSLSSKKVSYKTITVYNQLITHIKMSLTNHSTADLNFALHEIQQQERCVILQQNCPLIC